MAVRVDLVDVAPVDRRQVQRRTVSLLASTQIVGGVGVATGNCRGRPARR